MSQKKTKTFDDAAVFLQQLFPDMSRGHLRHMLAYVTVKLERMKDASQQETFLEEFNTTGVGPYIRNCGMTRTKLVKGDFEYKSVQGSSCGLLLDLDCFRKK